MPARDIYAPPTPDELNEPAVADDMFAPPSDAELMESDTSFMGTARRAGDYAGRAFQGFSQAAQDMVPFVEPIRKAADATFAGAQQVADVFRPEEENKTFGEHYAAARALGKGERKRKLDQAPSWAKGAGTVAGMIPSVAMPMPGSQARTFGGALSRIAGTGAMSAAERGLADENQLFSDEDAVSAGTWGGGLQAIVEGLSPIAAKIAPVVAKAYGRVRNWAEENAIDRANKAVTGWNKRALGKMAKTGAATGDMSAEEAAGRFLLGENQEGKTYLGRLGRPENMVDKLESVQAARGRDLDQLAEAIDKAVPNGIVNSTVIANRIQSYADTLPKTGQTKPVIKKLAEEASDYAEPAAGALGPGRQMGFGEIRHQKGGYKFDPQDASTHAFGKEGSNELYRALMRTENEAADLVAKNEALAPELRAQAEQFRKLKRDEQAAINLGAAARDRVTANKANRALSPSDQLMGALTGVDARWMGAAGLGGALSALDSGDPMSAGAPLALGLAGAGAHRFIRTRGSAFAARALWDAQKLMTTAPEVLGPYARALQNAARNGQASFAATHAMLMENDPQYQNLMSDRVEKAEADWRRRNTDSFGPRTP